MDERMVHVVLITWPWRWRR